MKRCKWVLVVFAITFLFSACLEDSHELDLLITNAQVVTVDDSLANAQSIGIKNGKFVFIGNAEESKRYIATKSIDAEGQFIYPGLIDAHCHFTGYAMDSYKLDLVGTKNFDEIIEKVNEYAKTSDREWIEGRGWDQNDWPNKKFPSKEKLDELFPDKPVFLLRIDGHAALCNQKALNIAKITCDYTVEGGENILKNGNCTGILIDNAIEEVRQHIPKLKPSEAITYYKKMEEECFSYGLTSVVDCGVYNYVIDWVQQAYKEDMKIRTSFMLSDTKENFKRFLNNKPKQTERFNVFGFKFYSDGALGSRGAYLLEDYTDRHNHRGFLLKSADSLSMAAKELVATDYQMCTHAIGDGAVRKILEVYAMALNGPNDKRWRIEHAQVVHPDDFKFFGNYNIVPSVQPTHATSDMYWADERLGEKRLIDAYAYKKLLQQNGWMPLGTDFPVEYINPLFTFCSAVWRQDAKQFPEGGFQVENALTRMEALKGMTIWAAKSSFEEKEKGSISIGKYADFIMTDLDFMQDDFMKIREGKVNKTFVAGEEVYARE
jgi:predicted amidohydrolase YtcJ